MIVACAKTNSSKVNNTSNSSEGSTSSILVKHPSKEVKNTKIKRAPMDYSTSTTSSDGISTRDSNNRVVTTKEHDVIDNQTLDDNSNTKEDTTSEITQLPESKGGISDDINSESTNILSIDSSRSNVANISWHWPDKGNIIEKFTNASKGIDISGLLGDKLLIDDNNRISFSGDNAAIRSTLLSVSIALDIISSKLPLGVTTIYKVIMSNHIKFS